MVKGNKGEWSELYVLITLLAEGKMYQSDINLKKDGNSIYEIVKCFKDENGYDLEFRREDKILLYRTENNNQIQVGVYEFSFFSTLSKKLYDEIIKAKGNSFSIPVINEHLDKLNISKLKKASTSKADINLRIYDQRLAKETELGFSIKSYLGSKSTLFNTGSGNNFIYKVSYNLDKTISEFNRETYKPEKKISKISHRLVSLLEYGSTIKYKEIQSKQLWKNLKMIDGDLPEILGYALLFKWVYRENTLSEICDRLEESDPLNFYSNEKSEQKFYEYKLKKFLVESAMGMTSEKPWLGEYDKFGGVIIVKQDGGIVCFHVYDFNLLRNYLLNNTLFEQPSTGEDGENPGHKKATGKNYYYGWLDKIDNEHIFKINLQVRFK